MVRAGPVAGLTLACANLCAGSAYAQANPPTAEPNADLGGAQLVNRDWFTLRDYPRTALSYRLSGRVMVAFDITAEGRATNCRVVHSSGHDVLDRAACRPLERKARFIPAMDNGTAVATTGWLNIDF